MGLVAGVLIFGIIALIIEGIIAGVSILLLVARWFVFKKCHRPGWEGIIPFYGDYILCKVSGTDTKWAIVYIASMVVLYTTNGISSIIDKQLNNNIGTIIVLFVGLIGFIAVIASFVASYMINNNLAKKFGEGTGYAIGLTFLPFVFFPIIGFGKKYVFHGEPVK